MSLFHHESHPHQPRDINAIHRQEQQESGINQRIAVAITQATGTMPCAYAFSILAIIGFPGLISVLGPLVAVYVVWFSQTFLQLVFLPVLSVGQSVLGRHQEIMAEEQFNFTEKSYHNIEQVMKHLDIQDQKIIEILEKQNDILLRLAVSKEQGQ